MESQDFSPPHVDASRPSLGFPLGTALLLIIIFSLSGIFSCCYHWDKLRSLRRSFSTDGSDPDADLEHGPTKPNSSNSDLKGNSQWQSLPVLMPGDKVPKFIALPCPCEPIRHEKIVVDLPKPPKPPRFPVPLY
ncbi:hydroxyproline-rich glycoprotein family protein [Parasponia andersonii]|uniref:Hydroxyproline-rich glycoprotein family protein n=1 Tax=Parasponia andersonii TaxID=3476 RepID=A0A2P5BIQ4_PARAD|nr:hydroxyproline-rich glycoprotein family protein [Parasponia andersonii]